MADLQSKIRFVAIADAAMKTIRDLKREYLDLNKTAAGADVGPRRADATAATLAQKRAAAAEEKRLAKEAAAAERAAATEAAAAKKAATADSLAAKRAAAAEEKRLARESAAAETAAARATAAAQKAAAAEALAAKRAAAGEARKIAAQQVADENKARLAKEAADRASAQQAQREARQSADQKRQLGFQVTDIAVGLSTGQSPFYVLLQQGGQLKDTFGGVTNAARALLGIFTPLRLVVGGVAAAFGAIALGAIAGERESQALNKTLALTGNVAAQSLGQVNALATDIAKGQNAAIGSVRETLAALLASGSITQTTLGATARAVTALQKLTGDSSEEAIKAFDGQADNVTEWAIRSNKAYNFLTAQQVQYIRTLQAQGRAQEAIKFANDQLADTLQQRTAPVLGTIEKLWNSIKRTISDGKDLLLALGRDTTPEETVAKLKARLAFLEKGKDAKDRTSQLQYEHNGPERERVQGEIARLEAESAATKRTAKERADAELAEQKKIYEGTKEYTDAIAQLSAAGAQTELANTLAMLDRRQSAIEQRNARGLLEAADYNRQINAIDQLRLKAQEATLKRQIEIEAGKTPGTPVEKLAQDSAVQQLEAQLIGVRSQISQAASKAQQINSAAALDDARKSADEWEKVWDKAYTALRGFTRQNQQEQAQAITDPIARANEEARIATQDVRNQFIDLQRRLELQLNMTIDPAAAAQLEQQIDQLSEQARKAIEDGTRKAQFDSLRTQYSELADLIATQERGINAEVERGQRTTESAEEAKRVLREAQLVQLQMILDKLNEIAKTPAERVAVEDVKQHVEELRTVSDELGTTFRTSAGREFSQVFRDITTGAQTAQGAVKGFISGIASSMLDVISRRLGQELLDSLLPKDGGGGGGFGAFITSAVSTVGNFIGSFFHTGGIVGRPGGDRRPVNPAVFAFAPRYHTGGIAGLRPNEVPAILQAGEEVLTANDPRHSRNGGASGGVNVGINVTVTGAQGNTAQQQSAGNDLGSMLETTVLATIDRWATREKRSGGLLAGRS